MIAQSGRFVPGTCALVRGALSRATTSTPGQIRFMRERTRERENEDGMGMADDLDGDGLAGVAGEEPQAMRNRRREQR